MSWRWAAYVSSVPSKLISYQLNTSLHDLDIHWRSQDYEKVRNFKLGDRPSVKFSVSREVTWYAVESYESLNLVIIYVTLLLF